MAHNFPLDKIDRIEDIDGEVWKPIKGYNNKYYISCFGRVKSYKYKTAQLLTPSLNSKGYPRVALYKNGERKYYLIHRLVALAFVPNDDPLSKTTVDHKNRVKTDASYINLQWLSLSDNIHRYYRQISQEKPIDEKILSSLQ